VALSPLYITGASYAGKCEERRAPSRAPSLNAGRFDVIQVRNILLQVRDALRLNQILPRLLAVARVQARHHVHALNDSSKRREAEIAKHNRKNKICFIYRLANYRPPRAHRQDASALSLVRPLKQMLARLSLRDEVVRC